MGNYKNWRGRGGAQCFGSGRYEAIFVYDSNLTFISPIWPSLCFIDAKMLAEINSSIIYNSFYQHLVICKVRVWTTLYKETQCFGSGRYEDIFVYDSNLTFISPIWPSLCFIDAKMFAEINSSIIYYWDEFHTPLFSNLIMQVWEKWCVCHKLANVSLCCLVSLEAATM